MTRTTRTLRMLSSRNVWNSVRWIIFSFRLCALSSEIFYCWPWLELGCLVGCGFDLSKSRWWTEALIMLQVGEHRGVAAECARGEERIVRGQHEVAAAADLDERGRGCGLQVLLVAGEKLET